MCDGECPNCGNRHIGPYKSADAEWAPSGAGGRAAEVLDDITREDAKTPLLAYSLWTFLTVWLARKHRSKRL